MSFRITILGSSGALPAYGRFPSAQVVEIQNRIFLVDCGEGTQMQLMKYHVGFHRIDHILISHLHGDHYLGLMGLLFTMHLKRRTTDLHLYGQAGLDEIVTTQLKFARSAPSYKIHFHLIPENEEALIFEDKALTVHAIPLQHRLPCSGFLFREKEKPRRIDKAVLPEGLSLQQLAGLKQGHDVLDEQGGILYRNRDLTLNPRHARSYAYCSDTAYHEPLAEMIKEVDAVYHEATFMSDEADKARDTYHSTASQAASLAVLAKAKRLLLGHFSARYRELSPILEEARGIFPNAELAIEGNEYVLED